MFACLALHSTLSRVSPPRMRPWATGTAGFVALTALSAGLAAAGPFGAGNLVVEQIGTGTSTR